MFPDSTWEGIDILSFGGIDTILNAEKQLHGDHLSTKNDGDDSSRKLHDDHEQHEEHVLKRQTMTL